MTCPLDGRGQRSLVLSAVAGDAAGKNLASLGYISLQLVGILVIDHIILAAEYTHLSLSADAALLSHWRIRFLCFIVSRFQCVLS